MLPNFSAKNIAPGKNVSSENCRRESSKNVHLSTERGLWQEIRCEQKKRITNRCFARKDYSGFKQICLGFEEEDTKYIMQSIT